MSALSNESSSHRGAPKGLYPLVPSRSDFKTASGRKYPDEFTDAFLSGREFILYAWVLTAGCGTIIRRFSA